MCDRRKRISSKRIDRVIDLIRECSSDADCVQVDTSSTCRPTCGAWVHERYAERVKKLIDYLDQRYCATYQAEGCPMDAQRCAPQRGACVRGRCTGVPIQ
jgi:hypothetical protein